MQLNCNAVTYLGPCLPNEFPVLILITMAFNAAVEKSNDATWGISPTDLSQQMDKVFAANLLKTAAVSGS